METKKELEWILIIIFYIGFIYFFGFVIGIIIVSLGVIARSVIKKEFWMENE